MKKSKKFVLAGLVLAAITMVLLPLAGCKTEVDTNSPQQEQTKDTNDNAGTGGSDGENAGNGDNTSGGDGQGGTQQPGGKVVEYPGPFTSFQEAVAALDAGGTLRLTADVADVAERITIPAGKDFTLDLHGHTISGTNVGFIIEASAVFTITDSSQGQRGAIRCHGSVDYFVSNDGTLTVSGGTIDSVDKNGIINNKKGLLIVTGGKISGGIAGVFNKGSLEMKGGAITGKNGNGVTNDGSLAVSGGTIESELYNGVMNQGILEVNGGTITGEKGRGVFNSRDRTFYLSGNPTISGPLRLESPVTLVGPLTGTGTYGVDKESFATSVVVAVGSDAAERPYNITEEDVGKFIGSYRMLKLEDNRIVGEIFSKVVKAMEDGTTLKLIASVPDVEVINIENKRLTLDLNGFSISGSILCFEVTSSSVFTIIDSSQGRKGTITTNDNEAVRNFATFEVSGGTITATGEGRSGVSNYGTLTVNGGSITGSEGFGVDNRGTLTVSGGTITGALWLFFPVTLVGALAGGTYTVSTDHLGTDKIVAVGGSDTAEGAAYQITASDKDKFVVATGTVTLEDNQIVWTEPAAQ